MADFDTPYYTPMDQAYHHELTNADKRTSEGPIEEPIFPINMIGQTLPDIDPATRRNVLQQVEAAFRGGAGNIQLMMQVPGQFSPGGGGTKIYGDEVRTAIREMQKAAGAKITGAELPAQINNMSGFTQQGFSEEQRKAVLDEVRDTIKFVGDIAGGGQVDIVSWEYQRDLKDAKWYNKEQREGKPLFTQREDEHAILVDQRSGKIIPIDKKREQFYYFYDPDDPNFKETAKPNKFTWEQLTELAKVKGKGKKPEEFFIQEQTENQIRRLQGDKAYYDQLLEGEIMQESHYKNIVDNPNNHTAGEVESAKKMIGIIPERIKGFEEAIRAMKIQEKQLKDQEEQFEPISKFALGKSTESYAQAGIWAMEESQKNKYVQQGKGSVCVGPEMGWPQYYGSHPQEWVELIKESRKKMEEKLVKEQGYDAEQAKELAKKHIKGELDTAHLGMWLQSFKTDLPWDERVKEFKKWYKGQIEYLAEENKKYDLIGGIQVVDSANGSHGHLPPGQGILGKDIFEYMKILKEKGGYKGELTSEGHEEETFGQGRILTKAWEAFGSPIGTGYWAGNQMPMFRDIRNAQAMTSYGTTGIYQSYVPSNDFTLWSNVPLE